MFTHTHTHVGIHTHTSNNNRAACVSELYLGMDGGWFEHCSPQALCPSQDNYTFAQPGIQKKVKALEELVSRIDGRSTGQDVSSSSQWGPHLSAGAWSSRLPSQPVLVTRCLDSTVFTAQQEGCELCCSPKVFPPHSVTKSQFPHSSAPVLPSLQPWVSPQWEGEGSGKKQNLLLAPEASWWLLTSCGFQSRYTVTSGGTRWSTCSLPSAG